MWQHEILEGLERLQPEGSREMAVVLGTLMEYVRKAETYYFGDSSRLDGLIEELDETPMPSWTDMPGETVLLEWEQPAGAGLLEQQLPAPKRAMLVRSDFKSRSQTFYSFFCLAAPFRTWNVCMLKKRCENDQMFTSDMFGLCIDKPVLEQMDAEFYSDICVAKIFMEVFNSSVSETKEIIPSEKINRDRIRKRKPPLCSYKVVKFPD